MKRIPEKGEMESPDEVLAYDAVSRESLDKVEELFVRRAAGMLSDSGARKYPLVLDVGTGTANIPLRFADRQPEGRFIALDLSWNMLRKAASNIRENGSAGRILLVCAEAEQLPFRSGSFDLVYSHSAIHHLPEPVGAVEEIVRVTRSKCPFIVRDLRRPPGMLLKWYVRIFGFNYSSLAKKMYLESLRAGYTYREMKLLAAGIKGATARARRFFITHVGLEGTKSQARVTLPGD